MRTVCNFTEVDANSFYHAKFLIFLLLPETKDKILIGNLIVKTPSGWLLTGFDV
jgi:hypothetical protein